MALASSLHIVVLMNELYRCNCYVPLWGVKSGERTITQSNVRSGPTENQRKQSKKQQAKTTQKSQKPPPTAKNRGVGPDQKSPRGRRIPLNWDLAEKQTQNTSKSARSSRRCPAKHSTQQRRNPGSPLPGSRRSR